MSITACILVVGANVHTNVDGLTLHNVGKSNYSIYMNSSIVGTYRNVCADNGSLPFNIAASMQNLGNVRLNPPGGCLVGPPPPPPPPQPGLVGWWRFNENAGSLAGDSSGNNNVGTLVGGPIWTVGKEGSALQFNGRTQRVTLPNTSTLNLAAKPTEVRANPRMASRGRAPRRRHRARHAAFVADQPVVRAARHLRVPDPWRPQTGQIMCYKIRQHREPVSPTISFTLRDRRRYAKMAQAGEL